MTKMTINNNNINNNKMTTMTGNALNSSCFQPHASRAFEDAERLRAELQDEELAFAMQASATSLLLLVYCLLLLLLLLFLFIVVVYCCCLLFTVVF